MDVSETGIWNQSVADQYHQSSDNLAKFLTNYLPKDKHVFDFGCGNAFYISKLEEAGFTCMGFEGFPLNNFLSKHVYIQDLTKPIEITEKGSVISLEVAEHIDKKFEQIFLNTITSNVAQGCKLVFSWALTGQPGIGHCNCVDQPYAISEIERRGFKYDEATSLIVRPTIEDNCSWFTRTLMLFNKI